MKFGKLLQAFQADNEVPECLLDYKKLKKKLKVLAQQKKEACSTNTYESIEVPETPKALLSDEERQFVELLNEDVNRINDFFIDQEEEAVIKLKALEDKINAATGPSELRALSSALIDFHGEMVLLLHWSLVNYAAVAKILKKHDKLTGSLLRAPYLSSMLQQPFLSTESISRLVRQAETQVQLLAVYSDEQEAESGRSDAFRNEDRNYYELAGSVPQQRPQIVKRTHAALGMLQELQQKASTPSTLLPPAATRVAGSSPKRMRVCQGGGGTQPGQKKEADT